MYLETPNHSFLCFLLVHFHTTYHLNHAALCMVNPSWIPCLTIACTHINEVPNLTNACTHNNEVPFLHFRSHQSFDLPFNLIVCFILLHLDQYCLALLARFYWQALVHTVTDNIPGHYICH